MAGRPPDPGVTTGRTGDAWLRDLPGLARGAALRWDLEFDPNRPLRHGACALVVPVRQHGTPEPARAAVLKITWPHVAAGPEHLALRAWSGQRAVRLRAADPATWTLLLDALDADRDLAGVPIEQACTVIGGLLADLAIPAPGWATRLSGHVGEAWERLDEERVTGREHVDGARVTGRERGDGGPPRPPARRLPRRFLDQARSLTRDLTTEPEVDGTLVHTDLHYANVLARLAPDQGWAAIDPKPLAADPAYGVWPALHNRWAELGSSAAEIGWEVHCRLGWICEAAGIDEDRARSWAIVRTVLDGLGNSGAHPDTDLTRTVTLLKALQPR